MVPKVSPSSRMSGVSATPGLEAKRKRRRFERRRLNGKPDWSTLDDYPKYCPNSWRKRSPKFLPMLFPLGVVGRFRVDFAEHVTLRPYGQQLLKLFCSRDGESLERCRRSLVVFVFHRHRYLRESIHILMAPALAPAICIYLFIHLLT